ncbi:MAG: hypothetical protein R3F59_38275 [Myxococcota bacterium]
MHDHPLHGLVALAILAAGCADYSVKGNASATSSRADTGSSTSATSTQVDSGASSTAGAVPAYYAVAMGFDLVEGEIDPATATFAVTLWSDEDAPLPLCVHDVPLLGAVAEAPPALDSLETGTTGAGGLGGWWALDLGDGVPDEYCDPWPARALHVGLGPYDPRLDAALDAAGLLGLGLYGLYLQEDGDDTVYVVGVGGTAEMFAGGYGPDPEAPPPLPDGAYQARSLVLMGL